MKYFSRAHNRSRNLRPPDLYEYFVDNYWFKSVDLENQKINEPLRGNHKADILIIGGGFTGLSSAYHIKQKFPEKHIVLLEGACCGYGASGRNGGFCIATDLLGEADNEIEQVLAAMNGEFISPNLGGNPVLKSETLPSGSNFYAFDEQLIPTEEAWEQGKALVDEWLASYY